MWRFGTGKKNVIFILVFIVYLFIIYNKSKYSGTMELCSNFSLSYNNGTIEHLAVIVHRRKITDKEKCAKEVIEHCVRNDFDNIKFYYGAKEYPNEIHATIYLDENDFNNNEYVFKMVYKQAPENNLKYNIIENPDKFYLEIEL